MRRQVWVLAVAAAGVFTAAFFIALQGILLNTIGERFFRWISPALRGLSLAALLIVLFLFPLLSQNLSLLLMSGNQAILYFPPFWFLGLYQTLLEGRAAFPVFHALAATGGWALLSIAALAFLLLPPLSPANRTRRLLASTLRDLRRIAAGDGSRRSRDWKRRIYARLIALPNSAVPIERAQLTAAVTAGAELIHLRRAAHFLPIGPGLERAFVAVAEGRCMFAAEALARVDRALAAMPVREGAVKRVVRARASILALTEILDQHAIYFCAGTRQ